jgi:hypothetical protein
LIERASDRHAAFVGVQAFLRELAESPEQAEAVRVAGSLLDLPTEVEAGLLPRRTRYGGSVSRRAIDAGNRLERSALAGVAAHPDLARVLAELGPEHFDDPLHRRARAHLLGGPQDAELTPLLAELYARADEESITERTAEQLLLKLRERRLRRELESAGEDERKPLEEAVSALREELERLATMAAADPR